MPQTAILPSVGRIVHFHDGSPESKPEAAIVVAVHGPEVVSLVAWNAGGTARTFHSISYSESAESVEGSARWCWPPRIG